jgi:hypothetical protein
MATTLAKQLVLDALNMALATRRPRQVIHHSDQGSQYTSIEFGRRCRDAGVRPSMGSVGDAYDNAMCESFFATLECELLARSRFKTQADRRCARRRRHRAGRDGRMAPPRVEPKNVSKRNPSMPSDQIACFQALTSRRNRGKSSPQLPPPLRRPLLVYLLPRSCPPTAAWCVGNVRGWRGHFRPIKGRMRPTHSPQAS